MAQKLKGVSGVLGNIISQPQADTAPLEASTVHSAADAAPAEAAPPAPARNPQPQAATNGGEGKKKARLGRPLRGNTTGEPIEREKVSLRLRSDLAQAYRDWSWEEHCQFSDLVDRALESFLKSRGKARKPERE